MPDSNADTFSPRAQLEHLIATHNFMVIGHRGAAGLAPENTLKSFATALEWGCPMLELDVYAVSDDVTRSELVVIHDDTLNRTTNGRGKVMAHSLAELRRLDAGLGQPIPLLIEVAALIETHNANTDIATALNIELKGPDTAQPTAAFLQDRGTQHSLPILVSSFDHQELYAFTKLAPRYGVAPLYDRYRDSWPATAEKLEAIAINLSRRIATPARIAAMRDAGYAVFVYTVNTVTEAESLQAAGANGVFTDRPDLMAGLG